MARVGYNDQRAENDMASVTRLAHQAYTEAIAKARANGNTLLAVTLQQCYMNIYDASMKALDAAIDLQGSNGEPVG